MPFIFVYYKTIMHGIFAGLMGIMMGLSSFFHMGSVHTATSTQIATASNGQHHGSYGMNLPNGEQPFFGIVTAVNGSVLTVQMNGFMFHSQNPSVTPSLTPPTPRTVTVDLVSNTAYVGGTESTIQVSTKIAGLGTKNNDGSLTAVRVQINPPFPTPGANGHHFGGFMGRSPMTPVPTQ